ncbi:restriction endonuclease subunit S [Actinomyces oricola]
MEDGSDIDSDKWLIERAVVLVSRLNPRKGTVIHVDHGGEFAVASTEFVPLCTGNKGDDRLLAYILGSQVVASYLDSMARSTTRSHQRVQPSQIRALGVPWAKNAEDRRAIVDFLDRETAQIDAMIEANEKVIVSLGERRTAALASVLLPQSSNSRNGSGRWFGSVEWDAPKLWRHARITNGSTPRRGREDYWGSDFPWLNSSVVNQDAVTDADQFVTETALDECHLPIVPVGSVLIGLTGQGKTRGKATQLRLRATINQHVAAIIPDNSCWDSRFLTLVMRTAYDELRRISDANGATKGALTCEALAAFRVPMPPLTAQHSLAAQADAATARTDELIEAASDVSNLLRERRKALITAAVAGRIDPRTGVEKLDELLEKETS